MAILTAEKSGSEGFPRSDEDLLQAAYGTEFGKIGHDLAGHTVIDQADVASVLQCGQGSSLLYGELLPSGVCTLCYALFAGRPEDETVGPVLELGMGTGKAALQIFLALKRDVYGVELAPNRWALADAGIQHLAAVAPERFRYEKVGENHVRLKDMLNERDCDMVCGSLLDTPAQLLSSAAAIMLEVCLPLEVQRLTCGILQNCRRGCRVVCYAPLHGLVDNCRLAPVRIDKDSPDGRLGDGVGGLCLPASWKPPGHGFAFYELEATRDASMAAWSDAMGSENATRVAVDATGNPSRARNTKYTDAVLPQPEKTCRWSKGAEVMVGWSWLPFMDLGNPGDGSEGGLDGVTWMGARIVSIVEDGFATICYEDDGTVEENVHPERIRNKGYNESRDPVILDWGDDE